MLSLETILNGFLCIWLMKLWHKATEPWEAYQARPSLGAARRVSMHSLSTCCLCMLCFLFLTQNNKLLSPTKYICQYQPVLCKNTTSAHIPILCIQLHHAVAWCMPQRAPCQLRKSSLMRSSLLCVGQVLGERTVFRVYNRYKEIMWNI